MHRWAGGPIWTCISRTEAETGLDLLRHFRETRAVEEVAKTFGKLSRRNAWRVPLPFDRLRHTVMKRPPIVPLFVVLPAIVLSISAQPSYAQVQQPVLESTQTFGQTQPSGQFPALIAEDQAESGEGPALADGFAGPIVTTVSSLLVVLAIFGGLVWISRRYGSTRTPSGALPEDVLRNLGSAAIDAKTRVTFLKVGQRILVIGQTQTGDPQTLSEITDPDEVGRLANRCLGRPEIVGRRGSFAPSTDASRRDLAAG